MLYGTTRANADIYTANHALCEDTATNGGLFVPYKMPQYSVQALAGKSLSERLQEILVPLFGVKLSAWDIDCALGRAPIRLASMHRRTVLVECWHNLGEDYAYFVDTLSQLLSENAPHASQWTKIAVGAAVLFAVFTELSASEEACADVIVSDEELSFLMSAWYAREWGLPIGKIVLCCREDAPAWTLIHRGVLPVQAFAQTTYERLLFSCGGAHAVQGLLDAQANHAPYAPPERVMKRIRERIYASVVSEIRAHASLAHIERDYPQDANLTLARKYCAIMDYRAVTGANRTAVVFIPHCNKT